ncbi:MAG: hydrogenase nickel incorporation protein HypB [Fidelibacterota bacterium]
MCDTCGCGQLEGEVTIKEPHETPREHYHDHDHPHSHGDRPERVLQVEKDILANNNLIAERNRGYWEAKGIFTLNLVSSPGSGKTTLLERTIMSLKNQLSISVIEGDQQSLRDANRIKATGVPVIQVNTGTGCHLDAAMINNAMKKLTLKEKSLLLIENVGNLVCPALFDLGEAHKVVIISTTEGDDKPHKYPFMFSVSDLCIINKIDLLPYVDFDIGKCKESARQVNHNLEFMEVSAVTSAGLTDWYSWINSQRKLKDTTLMEEH